MSEIIVTTKMPVLALRGMTVFPEQTVHFDVGRIKSALALDAAMKRDQILYLVPQKNLMDEDPALSGLYSIGCVVKVKQILKSQGEHIRVLVTGMYRAKITDLTQTEPFLRATVEQVESNEYVDNLRCRALRREANSLYGTYLDMVERPV
jgi:ATP-dependent Lon protease